MAKASQRTLTISPVVFVFLLVATAGLMGLLFRSPMVALQETILVLTVALLLVPLSVRQVVMDQMGGGLRFPPAKLEDFPKLDAESVARYSAELESLGFVPVKDFALESDSKRVPTAFARHFIHTGHNCLAEVNQVFPRNAKPIRVTCILMSWFGTEGLEQEEAAVAAARAPLADPNGTAPVPQPVRGYYYCTHNRKANSLNNMLRHGHALGTRLETMQAAEILRVHLERQQLIANALGQAPVGGDLEAVYFAFNERLRGEIGRSLSRRDPWTPFWAAVFKGNKQMEWLGDLAGKI
jgi:hypothetical protein